MFSSTFPPILKTEFLLLLQHVLPFNLLNCFAISSQDNFNSVSLLFRSFQSISHLLFILHWQGRFFIGRIWSKGINESMLILSNLEFPALPYVYLWPIIGISDCQNIDFIMRTKSSSGLVGG